MSEIDDITRSQVAVAPRQVDPDPGAGVVTVEMLAGHVAVRHGMRDERRTDSKRQLKR